MEFKDHIDKIFSARLKEHSHAPPQSTWQAIEQRLDEAKPGKRGGRFFMPIFVLVTIIAIVGFFLIRDQSTTMNEGLSTYDNAFSNISETNVQKNKQILNSELENESIQSDNSGNIEKTKAITAVSEPFYSSKISSNKANIQSKVYKNSDGSMNRGNLGYSNEERFEEQQLPVLSIDENDSFSDETRGEKGGYNTQNSGSVKKPMIASSLPGRTYQSSFSSAFLAQRKHNQRNVERPTFRLAPFKAKYSFRSQPGRYYLDMIFSTDFSIKTLKEREDRFSQFVDHRIDTERLFFAYMGALRISRVFDRGFAIRTGVNYSQVTEIFNHEEYQSENHLRMIDVPVIAGWEFDYDNFGLTVNSGFVLNAYFVGQGMILNEALEVVDIQSEDVFKNNIGASIYLSTGLNYDVSQSTQLIFEPYYKRMLGQVTKKDYPLRQRYTFVGLQFGLRHKF